MKIAVIGTGYVGLVTGTCFAENGHDVISVDIDERRIKDLNAGVVPFYEPGLEEITRRNIKNKRLRFTLDAAKAIQDSQVIFIAVGTPSKEDGSADLKYVLKVAETIADNLNDHKVVVLKSTVPIGTWKKVQSVIRNKASKPFSIVSNPEFLKEGTAVQDFLFPERIVIGTSNENAKTVMQELYEPFVRSGNPILEMDNTSAELSKYACNAFLATKISFINEIANLCSEVKANVDDVRKAMMSDSRIGKKFLYPGTGYGGSCFPKDVRSLLHTSRAYKKPLKIIEAVEAVNEKQKETLFHKVSHHFQSNLKDKTIAIWGLSFKPNTDDIREAPATIVIQKLLDAGATVKVYDPIAVPNVCKVFENRLTYCKDSYECITNADALLIITEWNEFRKPDFPRMKTLLKQPTIFDGRNLFSPSQMKKQGFHYEGIGLV